MFFISWHLNFVFFFFVLFFLEQAASQKLKVKALIMDPEIVFVASLTKADAPALAVSFQGNFLLSDENSEKKVTGIVKEFKVLACPFLRELRGNNITTV